MFPAGKLRDRALRKEAKEDAQLVLDGPELARGEKRALVF